MTVKAFISSDKPFYQKTDTDGCPPDCPVSKLIQLGLLEKPHECEKCGDLIVESKAMD